MSRDYLDDMTLEEEEPEEADDEDEIEGEEEAAEEPTDEELEKEKKGTPIKRPKVKVKGEQSGSGQEDTKKD